MTKLIDQAIPTLYQGVSRQPDVVRLPGQVEAANNVLFSVVTGGFEKRPGTIHIAELTGMGSFAAPYVHFYRRDDAEQYVVLVGDEEIHVWDLDGDKKTVDTSSYGTGYLAVAGNPNDAYSLTTIADYTIIVNKEVVAGKAAPVTGTVLGTKQSFSDLPGSPTTGDIWKVIGENAVNDRFSGFFVKWDGSAWIETADPNDSNDFDWSTMPHRLVRESNGTFTFTRNQWAARLVGDDDLTPAPAFVERRIQDVSFIWDRLVLVADETADFSQAGDYFNFWPETAQDVVDSDPFGRVTSGKQINVINFVEPFRKSLFLTSAQKQFEISGGDQVTPRTAVIDPSTSYKASTKCRPVSLGDLLFFPSSDGKSSIVWEYYYDDATISNTAANITKHCEGYIPDNLRQLTGDSVTGTLFALSEDETSSIYVYRYYLDGNKKVMSSWGRWVFDGADIKGMSFVGDYLYLVISRNGALFLEKISPHNEFGGSGDLYVTTPFLTDPQGGEFTDTEHDLSFDIGAGGSIFAGSDIVWPVRLDRRLSLQGSYDSNTGLTTWTLPYQHNNDVVVILSDSFDDPGRSLTVDYPTNTTVTFEGNAAAAGTCIVGVPYQAIVALSKQYVRQGDNEALTSGRLQLRRLQVNYQLAGYFQVAVTPLYRPTMVNEFTGRLLGSADNLVGYTPIVGSGSFSVGVGGRGETVDIRIYSSSHLPFTITSARWLGTYHEISRAE